MKSPRKTPLLRSIPALTASALLLFGVAALLAQDPPPAPVPKVSPPPISQSPPASASQDNATHTPSDNQGTLRVNVNLVILPVTVKDRSGRLVPDLTRTDFRILDDDVEQRLEYFSAEAF